MVDLTAGADGEVHLLDLLSILWGKRTSIALVVLTFAVSSVVLSFSLPEWYRADVLLAPAEANASQSGLVGQLGALGSLAGLTGLSIGKGGSGNALAVLKSRDFARAFIEKNKLLHTLLADQWNEKRNAWDETDPAQWPDVRDAIDVFHHDVLSVSEDMATGFVTISVRWTDQTSVAVWAASIVDQLNEQMRIRALKDSEENIKFLEEQLEKTSVSMIKQSLANLLESELQVQMLAQGNEEFSFRILDGPEVPNRRDRPKRLLIAIVGTVLGIVLAILFVLFRFSIIRESSYRKSREGDNVTC